MFVTVHIASSIIAVVSGAIICVTLKGTQQHKGLGRIYALAMICLAMVSFGIYEVTGSLSIFHGISIQSLFFVLAGVSCTRFLRKRLPEWRVWHGRFLVYSYITLIVTGTAQFFDRLPIQNEAIRALIFLTIPALLGWYLFEFRFRPQMSSFSNTQPLRNTTRDLE